MNLLPIIIKHAGADRQQRFRDARGFHASSALNCLRDQYWNAIGVEPTNLPDALGKMKMMVGSAIEAALVKEFFCDLHWYGIGLLGTQVSVGGTLPAWDGYVDVYIHDKNTNKKYAVEIKTKSGFGADLLVTGNSKMNLPAFKPSDEYLAQIGLYLKDMDEKGETNEGCLFYFLLSDNFFGEILQIWCRYDRDTKEVIAYRGTCTNGDDKEIDYRLNIQKILDRWTRLNKMIKEGKCPAVGDYKYKYELTPQLIDTLSDDKIRKMINGQLIVGDWQVKYSRYFTKQLETDNISREYTASEISLLRTEYLKRHPKSKI